MTTLTPEADLTTTTTCEKPQNGGRAKRWSSEEYYRLADFGFFDKQRVELLDGEIFVMPPQKDRHAIATALARKQLDKIFDGDKLWIREAAPLSFVAQSEPEPDVSIVPGQPRDYLGKGHPATALIVVEVSETSLQYDRTLKANLYARNGITDYWILNLVDMQVEVYRRPDTTTGVYADVQIFKRGQSISPIAAESSIIHVADLLP